MPRTPKKITEQRLLSKDDFTWSQKMSVRDWNACKKYFDDLYNRIDVKNKELEEKENVIKKQDEDIISLWKRVSVEKGHNKKICLQCSEKLKKMDWDITTRSNRYNKVASSKQEWKRIATIFILISIVLWLAMCYYWFLYYAYGTI